MSQPTIKLVADQDSLDKAKDQLIDKIMEKLEGMDIDEQLETVGLSLYEVIDEAILNHLKSMSFDKLIDKL